MAAQSLPKAGSVSHTLGWATDVMPTILGLAGVASPTQLHGKTLVPVLADNQAQIRSADEGIGYELGGNKAWLQGDYKLVLNRYGDEAQWQLFNLKADPAETKDLSQVQPERAAAMQGAFAQWADDRGVLPVTADYDQRLTVFRKGLMNRPGLLAAVALMLLAPVALLALLLVWLRRRRRVS
jgi:arylsulfatase/uncharacterized sulfatase